MNPTVMTAIQSLIALSASRAISPNLRGIARVDYVTQELQQQIGYGPANGPIDQMISFIMTLVFMFIMRGVMASTFAQEDVQLVDIPASAIVRKTMAQKQEDQIVYYFNNATTMTVYKVVRGVEVVVRVHSSDSLDGKYHEKSFTGHNVTIPVEKAVDFMEEIVGDKLMASGKRLIVGGPQSKN